MNIQDVFFVKYHQEHSFGFWRVVVVTASILNLEFVAAVKEGCDYVTREETLLVPEFLIAHCYASETLHILPQTLRFLVVLYASWALISITYSCLPEFRLTKMATAIGCCPFRPLHKCGPLRRC